MSYRCVDKLYGTRYVNFISIISLTFYVHSMAQQNSEVIATLQLKALNHLNLFLGDIQKKIKFSQNVLKEIGLNKIIRSGNRLPLETTMPRPPMNYEDEPTRDQAIQFSTKTVTVQTVQRNTIPLYFQTGNLASWYRLYKDQLRESDLTETTPGAVNVTLPAETTTELTTPGNILAGRFNESEESTVDPSIAPYITEIVVEHKGYLSVGFERLCEAIVTKDPKHIYSVFWRAYRILPERIDQHLYPWLKNPMVHIMQQILEACSSMPADELKSIAQVMLFTVTNRRQTLSEHINYLIDFAEHLVTEPDGIHLFAVINEFKDFPNTTKSGPQLCIDIVEAFELPFRPLKDSNDLNYLIGEVNHAFSERFPHLAELGEMGPVVRKFIPIRHHKKRHGRKRKHILKHLHQNKLANSTTIKEDNINDTFYVYPLQIIGNINNDIIQLRRYFHEGNRQNKHIKNDVIRHKRIIKIRTPKRKRQRKTKLIQSYTGKKRRERPGNRYQDVLKSEIVTRKLIDIEHKPTKITKRDRIVTGFNSVTKKLLHDDVATATIIGNTKQLQTRFNIINHAMQNVHRFDSKLYKGSTTNYAQEYTSMHNRYQTFNQKTAEVKRFQIVHTRLNHPNKRSGQDLKHNSDKVKYQNNESNITSIKTTNLKTDASKFITNSLSFTDGNNYSSKISTTPKKIDNNTALKINLIHELINYNRRLLQFMNMKQ